jgi:CRP/FNR family transcriptional regulator
MLDGATQQQLLQRYPMLRDLPAAQQNDLFSDASAVRLPQGMLVFDEEQACQGFPLLISGSVRVVKVAANGRELQLYSVSPGESCILTSSCLLGQAQYQARGIVTEDAVMVVLPPGTFKSMVNNHEPFRNHIFALFSERLSDLLQLVSAVAFQKLDQRLASLLLSKASPIRTTHQALADELGSVREIVSRLLKHFAEQGWVRLGREQIDVVDAPALAKLQTS